MVRWKKRIDGEEVKDGLGGPVFGVIEGVPEDDGDLVGRIVLASCSWSSPWTLSACIIGDSRPGMAARHSRAGERDRLGLGGQATTLGPGGLGMRIPTCEYRDFKIVSMSRPPACRAKSSPRGEERCGFPFVA